VNQALGRKLNNRSMVVCHNSEKKAKKVSMASDWHRELRIEIRRVSKNRYQNSDEYLDIIYQIQQKAIVL
jgi:hypothetical protein